MITSSRRNTEKPLRLPIVHIFTYIAHCNRICRRENRQNAMRIYRRNLCYANSVTYNPHATPLAFTLDGSTNCAHIYGRRKKRTRRTRKKSTVCVCHMENVMELRRISSSPPPVVKQCRHVAWVFVCLCVLCPRCLALLSEHSEYSVCRALVSRNLTHEQKICAQNYALTFRSNKWRFDCGQCAAAVQVS